MKKDAFYSLTPLNWLLRSVGLSNIYRKGSHLAVCGSVTKSAIYITTFGLINILCLLYKMQKFNGSMKTGLVRFSDAVQISYWFSYLVYTIDMLFVFKFGRYDALKYFKVFDSLDTILGYFCYDEIRKTIIITGFFSAAIFSFVCIFDYVCWVLVEGWLLATICGIDYLYFVLGMFTVLDVFSHVIQVEYRLKHIRHMLKGCNYPNSIAIFTESGNTKVFVGPKENKSLNSLNTLCSRYLETPWFIRCYLLLLDQAAYINTTYGFRILVYFLILLHNMINLLNLAIRIFNGTMAPTCAFGVLTLLSSVASVLRAANHGVMAIIVTYRCEQVYKETEKLLETIDVLLTSKTNYGNLKADLLDFRNLLITRPIKFHGARFFTIDYTLLVSLSSVVVTYTIIMLQSLQ